MGPLDDADHPAASIDQLLRCVAPDGVATASRPITDDDQRSLHDVELAAIATAGEQRRREFATGRALLRQLLGLDVAIPQSHDRRPAMPEGWVASLAHDAHTAVAALASATRARALGIDIEPLVTLERDIADVVIRPDDRVADPMTAFVLKEAAYKAWSTLGGRMLEHHDIRLEAQSPGRSGAAFTAMVEPDGFELRGRYVSSGHAVIALAVVPAGNMPNRSGIATGN